MIFDWKCIRLEAEHDTLEACAPGSGCVNHMVCEDFGRLTRARFRACPIYLSMNRHYFPCFLVLFLAFAGLVRADEAKDAAEAIAKEAGYEEFGSVNSIAFTFNAKIGEKEIVRQWKWWPKEDKVRYTTPTGEITEYQRNSPGMPKEIDGWFINDQYWLLFPMHLRWDENIRLEIFQPSPEDLAAVGDEVRGLRVIYPADVGYTPGDIYELFYNDAHRIVWWIFRKGGSPNPTMASAWKDYRKFGPLTISLDHPGVTPDFRIFFTEVEVD